MSAGNSQIIKLRADLTRMKEDSPGLTPNFSMLARETGISRQTISKIWKDPQAGTRPRRKKGSKFDPYAEEIQDVFERNPVSIRAVFRYFQNKYADAGIFTSCDAFKSFVKTNHLKEEKRS